jgi:K+-transporting ATPase ATPase C chain
MSRLIRNALMMLVVMSAITGIIYPLAVTGVAQVLFPNQANGSLLMKNGKPFGSSLIGQSFTDPKYFWGRPSATAPQANNGLASSGSNQGPTNQALTEAVKQRIAALREADPGNDAPVPVDLVTASGSGLDPEISPAAAEFQAARVARARGISTERVRAAIQRARSGRQFGILGEARVNVLVLNAMLDAH